MQLFKQMLSLQHENSDQKKIGIPYCVFMVGKPHHLNKCAPLTMEPAMHWYWRELILFMHTIIYIHILGMHTVYGTVCVNFICKLL